ncbi:adenylate/guanylate cyclase domain-containing protein [Mongoliimonas terrestris]|uniref:adenylate/guanylate cyclase domain-containing protein n=1 Tax=Mongoliimonas terrestris TaxID=1709001 RepID=UPI0009498AAF|nr:adenylate/guanylate cyclase domain-containing protein [Mongoliimonas terrestris]
MAADVANFGGLVSVDETSTLEALWTTRRIAREQLAVHGGWLFGLPGDGIFALFESAVDAVRCALDTQVRLAAAPGLDALRLRVGVHLGEVLFQDDLPFGEALVIAARLESLAEPGGILISSAVMEAVAPRISADFAERGVISLKHSPRRVATFSVAVPRADDRADRGGNGRSGGEAAGDALDHTMAPARRGRGPETAGDPPVRSDAERMATPPEGAAPPPTAGGRTDAATGPPQGASAGATFAPPSGERLSAPTPFRDDISSTDAPGDVFDAAPRRAPSPLPALPPMVAPIPTPPRATAAMPTAAASPVTLPPVTLPPVTLAPVTLPQVAVPPVIVSPLAAPPDDLPPANALHVNAPTASEPATIAASPPAPVLSLPIATPLVVPDLPPRPLGDTTVTDTTMTSAVPIDLARAARLLPDDCVEDLIQALTLHIGPVARMLVRRHAGRIADPDLLVDTLAAEIPAAAERPQFLLKARRIVRRTRA